MAIVSGLSGNEMYCLHQKGFRIGELSIGNSVFSVGFIGGIGAGLRTLAGGEVTQITSIIHEGRHKSFDRLISEAKKCKAVGITGVTSELIQHAGNVEFLSIGSNLHPSDGALNQKFFSTSADGQDLYCQMDAGFQPIKFAFGNVAYSIGIGGGIMGALRGLARGEVKQFSEIFNTTRHLALERIKKEAREAGANAVVGIKTSIIPFQGMQEMLMVGTASHHPALSKYDANPVTSDLTNKEMWNVVNLGYMPIKLVLGVSVYSLGIVGGFMSFLKGMVRGEINELTTMIYDARENAIEKIRKDAEECGADDVLGVKTYVYQLGAGMIEFMAIGTAVKKMSDVKTQSDSILPQAVITDKDTFVNAAEFSRVTDLNK